MEGPPFLCLKKILTVSIQCTLGLYLFMAAGCAVGPDYRPPKTTVPKHWESTAESEQKSLSTDEAKELIEWWKAFNDPLLDSLVERAIALNLDLAQAKSRIRQARASRGVVASGLWPQVDVAGQYERSFTGGSSRGTQAGDARSGQVSGAGGEERDLFHAGLDAVWELDIFGGVRRSVEASDADIRTAIEDQRDVLVSLVAEVGTNYVAFRGLQQEIAIARKNLKVQQHSGEISRKRYEAGYVGALDVANAEAQVATTESVIPTLESSAQGTLYGLSVLLGLEPAALSRELSAEGAIPVALPGVPTGLPSDLLRRRPDIRRAEALIHAATARIGVATADLFPKFSLTGSLGFTSSDLASFANWSSRVGSFGPSVTWPVFSAGRIRSNIEVQNALQEQSMLAYQKTVLTALKEVETALVAYAKERQHQEALLRAVQSNRKAVDLSMNLYVVGKGDFLNALTAQRSLFATEETLAQSSRNLATDLIALYKALGGGWENGHGPKGQVSLEN